MYQDRVVWVKIVLSLHCDNTVQYLSHLDSDDCILIMI